MSINSSLFNFLLAVQEERGPRKPKLMSVFTKIQTNKINTNYQNELISQILLVSIKQVRNNTGFGILNKISQNNILTHLWAPLFLLKSSNHWPIFDILPNQRSTLSYVKNLKLDRIDMEIVENLLLCRPDLIDEHGQISLTELMRNRAIENLIVCYLNTFN